MFISVIVCTYNRCQSLEEVLKCLLHQELGLGLAYEVVIVDNNSKDNTKGIVDAFVPQFQGRLRYFFEPQQGKPYALNLGIKEAGGDVLAFTDDDCFLEKDYLACIHKALKEAGPEIGFAGGKIGARWVGGQPPEWLNYFYPCLQNEAIQWQGHDKPGGLDEFFLGPIGILNYGDKAFILDYAANKNINKLFYGANMVIRREALEKHGLFDLQKTFSQDSEICMRLLKGGVKGLYNPQIVVYHKINTEKISYEYYYRWYALRGRYDTPEFPPKRKFYHPLGVPWAQIAKTISHFQKSLLVSVPYQRTFYRSNMIYNIGQMAQIARKNIF